MTDYVSGIKPEMGETMISSGRKSYRFGVVATSILLLLAVSAAWPGSIVGAHSSPHLAGPDVNQYSIARSPTQIIHGKPQGDGGCSFSFEGSVELGHSGSGLNEVAYDSKTCQAEIEFVPSASTGGIGPSTGAETSGGGSSGPSKLGAGGIAPAYGGGASCVNPYASNLYYPREACLRSWMQDPIGLHVTEITNEVQWTPSGGCATNGRSYASYYEGHYGPSGWFLIGNSWQPSFTCQAVTSKSDMSWLNTLFCATTWTYVGISQYIKGLPSGGYTWSVSWTKSGLCQGLLSFHAVPSP